jgi:hypothetical protein
VAAAGSCIFVHRSITRGGDSSFFVHGAVFFCVAAAVNAIIGQAYDHIHNEAMKDFLKWPSPSRGFVLAAFRA